MCYADTVAKNLTLTIDEDLLRSARKVALDRDTSVNQLVRTYLSALVHESGRQRESIRNIEEIFRTTRVTIGKKTWTRDDLHER